ncbi:MAG: hypothetical protein IJO75_07370 [Clostridia bacterium]|nr:hypothetical protein [Clostridia bacterium]
MVKETKEMLEQLKTAESLDGYLRENEDQLVDGTIREQLEAALRETGLSKAEVLRRAEINDIYGYQLFAGSRKPSRDKLIALCIGMSLTLDRTQCLLKATGFAPLYAKNKRDSILIFGIQNNQTVLEINTALYDHAEPTL